MHSILDDLPNELLHMILTLASAKDLLAACRTCRRLQDVAEPLLYTTVSLRRERQAVSFERALLAEPSRARSVRSLHSTLEKEWDGTGKVGGVGMVHGLIDVESYQVEDIECGGREKERRGIDVSTVPFLQEFAYTPYAKDSIFAPIDAVATIITNPNLEKLAFKYASLQSSTPLLATAKRMKKPLKSLSLTQCDFTAADLKSFLHVRPVKALSISRVMDEDVDFPDSPQFIQPYLDVIADEAPELEQLTLVEDTGFVEPKEMCRLVNLKHLTTVPTDFFAYETYSLHGYNKFKTYNKVHSSLEKLIPPNIETIDFIHRAWREPGVDFFCDIMSALVRDKSTLAPKLRKIGCVLPTLLRGEVEKEYESFQQLRMVCKEADVELDVRRNRCGQLAWYKGDA